MKENFEKDFSRFQREREKRKEKGEREPFELKKIPTFSELSLEETKFQREEIEKLLQEKDLLKRRLGIRMAFLLDLEQRGDLFSKYLKEVDRETWNWTRESLEDELGEEEARKFLEEVFPSEILKKASLWEKDQKIILPAASLKGILRAAAKSEEESEAEEERKILGQVFLTDSDGIEHETLYYEKKSRFGEIGLPFSGEKIRVVFDGQSDPETPYAIPEDGWFTPREEDRKFFGGEIRGRIIPE